MAVRRANPVVAVVLGAVLIIGGYFALKYGQKSIDLAKASVEWPSVPGKVERSEVVRSRDSDGDTMYRAEIIYRYAVNGEPLESDQRRIGATTSSSSSKGAYKVTRAYPEGKDVTVYYNPAAPEEAVLEPGVFLESKILWYVGIVFMVLGLLLAGWPLVKLVLIGGLLAVKRT